MAAHITDDELLARMFSLDLLEWEIFTRVYGIDAEEPHASYRSSGTLPDAVRAFCLDLLNPNVAA